MTSDGHKNHVGIGVDRATYNRIRKGAKHRGVSMRQYLKELTLENPPYAKQKDVSS